MHIKILVEGNQEKELQRFISTCKNQGFKLIREGGGKLSKFHGYYAELKGSSWNESADNLLDFDENPPVHGDLICVIPAPEQLKAPFLATFDKYIHWLDGDKYKLILPAKSNQNDSTTQSIPQFSSMCDAFDYEMLMVYAYRGIYSRGKIIDLAKEAFRKVIKPSIKHNSNDEAL